MFILLFIYRQNNILSKETFYSCMFNLNFKQKQCNFVSYRLNISTVIKILIIINHNIKKIWIHETFITNNMEIIHIK